MQLTEKDEQRFWNKVAPVDERGCTDWTAFRDKDGYGYFKLNGRMRLAHRVSYAMSGQTLDPDMEIDHLCRNRACVRVEHLEQVPHVENVQRGESGKYLRERTHCPQGHEYNQENTRWYKGSRNCRVCDRNRQRTKRSRKEK